MKFFLKFFLLTILLLSAFVAFFQFLQVKTLVRSLKNGTVVEKTEAVVLNTVLPDSPAQKAGLQNNDAVLLLDNKPASLESFTEH